MRIDDCKTVGDLIGEVWSNLLWLPRSAEMRKSLLRNSVLVDLGRGKFFDAFDEGFTGTVRVGLRRWNVR